MIAILTDSCVDTLKLLPFLFLSYMLLEFLEREAGDRSAKMIAEAKQFGPVIGGFLGIIPQCGFSAIASEFYAARVISLGALISVYLSTSDEMLPILVSERVSFSVIAKILLIKFVIGTLAGFLIDFLRRSKARGEAGFRSGYCELCHGDEKEPFFKEVCIHTFQIMLFIFLVTIVVNGMVYLIGADNLAGLILNKPVIGELLAGLIGLIPNCAASVIITQLYLQGVIQTGAIISGLLVSAGIGPLMLWRTNHHRKENLKIYGLLYSIGVVCGIIIELLGITL